MNEKRYYSVDYDEEYYIFDSNVIRKGRVEEEAEYSYDVFADSMSGDEIVDLLNNCDTKLVKIEKIVKEFDEFWTRIPKGYCSSSDRVYIVMKKMLKTIKSIREEVNDG